MLIWQLTIRIDGGPGPGTSRIVSALPKMIFRIAGWPWLIHSHRDASWAHITIMGHYRRCSIGDRSSRLVGHGAASGAGKVGVAFSYRRGNQTRRPVPFHALFQESQVGFCSSLSHRTKFRRWSTVNLPNRLFWQPFVAKLACGREREQCTAI